MTAAAAAELPTAPDGARQLDIRVPISADASAVLDALDAGAEAWLGEPVDAEEGRNVRSADGRARRRRFATDLRLRVSDRTERTLFRKAAIVELGTPVRSPDGTVSVEIGWRAATLAPLFPVFAGRLTVGSHEARLRGLYAPPGGRIGLLADAALLHLAAQGTARWLLRELESAVEDHPRR
jgi:hypothetical protein